MKQTLIVQGGARYHKPAEEAALLASWLREHDFEVEISDTLESFRDGEKLKSLDLIVPNWGDGAIDKEQERALVEAVRGGVGLGGIHAGMAATFALAREYHAMVGGQFINHPGGSDVEYDVTFTDVDSPITAGLDSFTIRSEQYYMHVDPALTVLATTRFGDTVMPVVWTKHYGQGRVFYCSLGHTTDLLRMPVIAEVVTRGLRWAAHDL